MLKESINIFAIVGIVNLIAYGLFYNNIFKIIGLVASALAISFFIISQIKSKKKESQSWLKWVI